MCTSFPYYDIINIWKGSAFMKQVISSAKNIYGFFKKFYGKKIRVNVMTSGDYNVSLNIIMIVAARLKPQYKFYLDLCTPSEYDDLNIKINTINSNKMEVVFNKEKLLSERFLEINIFYREKEDLHNLYVELRRLTTPYKDYTPRKPVELEMLVPPDDKTDPNYKKYMKQYWKNMNELYAEK